MTVKTWHLETLVASLVLFGVALATGNTPIEHVGAAAVLFAFGHMSVSERLRERDAARPRPAVECHRWLTRYLVSKELLWTAYFVMHGAWTGLAGVALFLLYPVWRAAWRRSHPLRGPASTRDAEDKRLGYSLGYIVEPDGKAKPHHLSVVRSEQQSAASCFVAPGIYGGRTCRFGTKDCGMEHGASPRPSELRGFVRRPR